MGAGRHTHLNRPLLILLQWTNHAIRTSEKNKLLPLSMNDGERAEGRQLTGHYGWLPTASFLHAREVPAGVTSEV